MSLTVSVLNRCNSRCQTCNVYEREDDLLTPDDYAQIFEGFSGLRWLTLSGGEPTLRDDLPEIVRAIVRTARPEVINLPTNGILSDRVLEQVSAMAGSFPGRFIVNLSLDAVGEEHDRLRGVPGNWDKAMVTYRGLMALKRRHPNLLVGIHSVISIYNVGAFDEISGALLELEPDSYITEVAEERAELLTLGTGITPDAEAYAAAIAALEARLAGRTARGAGGLIRALRSRYYRYVCSYLRRPREIWPCFAALINAQLMPNGELWCCCVRGDLLGDLRAASFDFSEVWRSDRAQAVRRAIKGEHCHCPLANMAYTNMMVRSRTLAGVGLGWARQRVGI